jgi:hypothetical protein
MRARSSAFSRILKPVPLDAVDSAQIAAAVFTATAAGASWASVAQTRRERKEREKPDMHVEVLEVLPRGDVALSVSNMGGPAKLVTFAAVQGGKACLGHLPPSAFMRPGESRTLGLDLPPDPDTKAVATVMCFDSRGHRLFAWSANNQRRSWRVRGFRSVGQKSADEIFESFYPGIRPTRYELVGYKLGERIV